jgi:hypothetical protein
MELTMDSHAHEVQSARLTQTLGLKIQQLRCFRPRGDTPSVSSKEKVALKTYKFNAIHPTNQFVGFLAKILLTYDA